MIFTTLIASSALAIATVAPETVTRVIDGDTFVLAAKWSPYPLTWQVRVLGIDTPEKGHLAKCKEEAAHSALAAKHTADLLFLGGNKVRLSNVQHDKYGGRLDANVGVVVTGKTVDLAQSLIAAGFARPYFGEGPKPDWCAILKPTNLLPQGYVE
jgi:endonuclease YncB( thermonuclease family)